MLYYIRVYYVNKSWFFSHCWETWQSNALEIEFSRKVDKLWYMPCAHRRALIPQRNLVSSRICQIFDFQIKSTACARLVRMLCNVLVTCQSWKGQGRHLPRNHPTQLPLLCYGAVLVTRTLNICWGSGALHRCRSWWSSFARSEELFSALNLSSICFV